MKIRVGDLKRIIKEELSASAKQKMNEAGDVEGWYKMRPKVPPALQKSALDRAGSFIYGADRQIRAMSSRAQELGAPIPQEVLALLPILDQLLEAFTAAAEAVEKSIKRVARKPGAVDPTGAEATLRGASDRAAAQSQGSRGALHKALAQDDFEDL
jgi:hypothetical protein